MKSRWLFLAMALSFAVVFCNLDNLGSTDKMAGHGHENYSGCVVDPCVTLISGSVSSPAGEAVVHLLLASEFGFGFYRRQPGIEARGRLRFIDAYHHPGSTNKLYQLHASYLL